MAWLFDSTTATATSVTTSQERKKWVKFVSDEKLEREKVDN
jgi:hypothetical protein